MMDLNYSVRVGLASLDREFHDHEVSSIQEDRVTEVDSSGFMVKFVDGTILFVTDSFERCRVPVKGDILRLFGKGFGFVVRGVALVDKAFNVTGLYRYLSEDEEKAQHLQDVAEKKKKQIAEWEAKKVETLEKVSKLPEPFRSRFDFFMKRPLWGAEFGFYEVFVMTQAALIAETFKTSEAIESFHKMSWEKQKVLLPGLDSGHSGNTFGAACTLANLFLTNPLLVPRMHGALCPLVGCVQYGCYSQSEEARLEREGFEPGR